MRLALTRTGDRRLAEASPHDNLWRIGLSACHPRPSSPDSWCGQNLLGQILELTREILRRDTTAPLCNPTPETPVPRDGTGDTVFEVDLVTHFRLDTDPPSANTQMATLAAFTDSVPDDHVPEVLLAQEQRIDAPLIPEEGPDLIGSVVTMDDATFTTLLSLHSGVSTTSRFNCRALLDKGSPQSFIHQEAFDQWSPRVLLMRPASDTRRAERGVVSVPGSCSAHKTGQNDRPVQPQWHAVRVSCSLDVHLYPTRRCDAPFFSVEIVGCASIHAPIKHSRRNQTVASSANSPYHSAMITSAAPPLIPATMRSQTLLITSSTTAKVCSSTTPHSLSR